MNKTLWTALAAIAAGGLFISAPAFADPPRGTPPGLAKKPGGLPPGQAKKMWRKGERLPSDYLAQRYYIEPARYRLQPAPQGYRWVLVQDNAYLVQNQTGLIAQVAAALLR